MTAGRASHRRSPHRAIRDRHPAPVIHPRGYTAADSLIVSDVPISYQQQDLLAETNCGERTCSSHEPFTGIGAAWDLSVRSLQGITYPAVGEKHGVKLA